MYMYNVKRALSIVMEHIPGKSTEFFVAQFHIAKTQLHLFQWSNKASVEVMDCESVSTLCLTVFLMLANQLLWWS